MKIWVISKKNSILLLTLFITIIAGLIVGRGNSVDVGAKPRELPIYCVDKGDEKILSISFDAAWGNEDTAQLIEILGKYDVKATFFVVGDWVDKYPDSVKQLSDAGHEIMNHSNKHPHMSKLSKEEMKAEINECNDKIEAITGVRPTLFRAPYGDYNDEVIKTIRECGCYPIQWDTDSLDWKDLTAEQITKRVTDKAQSGSIVLFHNAAKHTPQALPSILENFKANGYSVVPISQLIYTDNYTIDNAGKQYLNSAQ